MKIPLYFVGLGFSGVLEAVEYVNENYDKTHIGLCYLGEVEGSSEQGVYIKVLRQKELRYNNGLVLYEAVLPMLDYDYILNNQSDLDFMYGAIDRIIQNTSIKWRNK